MGAETGMGGRAATPRFYRHSSISIFTLVLQTTRFRFRTWKSSAPDLFSGTLAQAVRLSLLWYACISNQGIFRNRYGENIVVRKPLSQRKMMIPQILHSRIINQLRLRRCFSCSTSAFIDSGFATFRTCTTRRRSRQTGITQQSLTMVEISNCAWVLTAGKARSCHLETVMYWAAMPLFPYTDICRQIIQCHLL